MTQTHQTRSAELALLDVERDTLLERLSHIPEERRAVRPAPDRWSVADVLEHLARVERGVARLLETRGRERPAAGAASSAHHLTAEHAARLRDRSARLEAPDRVRPTGAVTPEAALRQLTEAREGLRAAFLAADPESLDGVTHEHPRLGVLTLRHWVLFVAHHEARHTAQIVEIGEELAAR